MTTSGTATFDPSISDMVIEAFDRIGCRATSLTRTQLVSAYRSINYAFSTWANRGVNLWAVDVHPIVLVAGQSVYNVPQDTVQVLDVYLRYQSGTSDPIDRILYPISRTDYAALPDKVQQGTPSCFYFNRLSPVPTLTLWQVPNDAANWSVQFYRTRRIQDANLGGGQTADIPYRFLEACVTDLSARLAQKFNPQMWPILKQDAALAWKEASDEDTERVTMNMAPDFSSYYG